MTLDRLVSILLALATLAALPFVLAVLAIIGLVLYDEGLMADHPVVVASRSWSRTLALEELHHTPRGDWCANVPVGAVITATEDREQNGKTYSWCDFTTHDWVLLRDLTTQGSEDPPAWPILAAPPCDLPGCQRLVDPRQTFTLRLDASGWTHDCEAAGPLWILAPPGANLLVPVGGIGGVRCDDLALAHP